MYPIFYLSYSVRILYFSVALTIWLARAVLKVTYNYKNRKKTDKLDNKRKISHNIIFCVHTIPCRTEYRPYIQHTLLHKYPGHKIPSNHGSIS